MTGLCSCAERMAAKEICVASTAASTPQTSGPRPRISSTKSSSAWAWPLSGSAVNCSNGLCAAAASAQAARFLASQPGTPPLRADVGMAVLDHGIDDPVGCILDARGANFEHVVNAEVGAVAHKFVEFLAVTENCHCCPSTIVARAPLL